MQELNRSVFRQGVVFGFGLIIPLSVLFIGYNTLTWVLATREYIEPESYSYSSKEEDHIKAIEIQSFKDVKEDNFVMVLGSIKNTGKEKISSVKLEAEFFNSNGDFVYEESEYISKSLAPNETENFAIKCGCTNRKFPEYTKVIVRVVSASNY